MLEIENSTIDMMTELISLLKKNHQTVSTAESCTGGILASLLTHLPGSSDIYKGGVSAYSNQLKEELLGVAPTSIEKFGAVSATVAEEMASGIAKISKSNYAISVTGVAGPGGGSPEKPVGTIWCGFFTPTGCYSKHHLLGENRENNRWTVSNLAIEELFHYIKSCKN